MGRVLHFNFPGDPAIIDTNIVSIDNALVNSAYSMTTNAKRLLVLAFAQQDPNRCVKKGEQLTANITARQWSELYRSGRRPYDELESAAHELQRAILRVYPTEEYYEQWNFTEMARYYAADNLDDARVEISFTSKVSNFLGDLFERYTSYDLRMVAELSSFYATRMYELIAQYRDVRLGTGWVKKSIDDLKVIFDATEKYKRNNDFVKNCIVNAIAELNQKTDMEVTYELTRKGRRYDMLHMNFKPKKQMQLL
uniref:replication initiation protein n=1 Tax=Marinobacterium profundum TaxID=1714300 RepID=UPI00082F0718|nr:replication initiation protein [Marinobacterium profundum]